jgi:AAA+ ATPase superfamily predicted ATPase
MDLNKNPFPVSGYFGSEYFCNRSKETQNIVLKADNGVNTTLISIRRMGKTGLIQHVFNQLSKENKTVGIYIDIFHTQNLADFINKFATTVVRSFPVSQPIGKKILAVIKQLRPIISYDQLTGNPEISFDFQQPSEYEHSLKNILDFLDAQNKPILIAIDEFQQIVNYPEKNVEALLRSNIQSLKNIQFIFSGSHKHLMMELFNNVKRPFYSSTQTLYLGSIEKQDYAAFIEAKINGINRIIEPEAIQFILDWTDIHTYYTQVICNRIVATGTRKITLEKVKAVCNSVLEEQSGTYFQYRNMLTTAQWQFLQAVAKENRLYHPTAKDFIQKHKLGTPASVKRTLESVLTKELIFQETDEKGNYYRIYDIFLSRWLARKY